LELQVLPPQLAVPVLKVLVLQPLPKVVLTVQMLLLVQAWTLVLVTMQGVALGATL
jgi:hypothetical protein